VHECHRNNSAQLRHKGREGNQKVFDGFIDCDGITLCVHNVYRTKAAEGNDNCSKDLISANFMNADEIAGKERMAYDLGRRATASP
jgi:hypothetical protein